MRRALQITGIVVLLALAVLANTFRAATLPLEPLPAFAEPERRGPETLRIAAIPAGTMKAKAAFAYRGGRFGDERTFSMGGILVRHPRGNLLIDTGFGKNVDEHLRKAPALLRATTTYEKGTPVAAQLASHGIDPHQLMGIVLTHAHWDHVSGIDDMRDVPVLVPEEELEFIHQDDIATSAIRALGALRYRTYEFEGAAHLGFERSHDFFGDGSVVAVLAGGHTPGSVIVFVTPPRGPRYAFVGDIVWQKEGVELPAERPFLARKMVDKDEARVRTVIVRLHALEARFPDLVVVPAHDARVWATLPTL